MSPKAKLKWHCRRGLRELDLLLDGFLEEEYDALAATEGEAFERLLECENQELTAWLIDGDDPADAGLTALVARIRNRAARGRQETDSRIAPP